MKFSILIPTKDRPKELRSCLLSILDNTFRSYEILVIDDSTTENTRRMIEQLASRRIRYYRSDGTGNTRALNMAMAYAKGDIFVFTDDDCIIPKTWLSTIDVTYKRLPQIAGLSGQILPYEKTRPNKRSVSPGLYISVGERFVTTSGPTVHAPQTGVGKGQNISFRKEIFQSLGGFKEWLGPGKTALGAANETEFMYRALRNGYTLYFLSDLIVYHNRWLTPQEMNTLLTYKIQGYTAFITYYLVKHLDLKLIDGLWRFRRYIMQTPFIFSRYVRSRGKLSTDDLLTLRMFYGIMKGMRVGAFFAVYDRVRFK